MVAPCVALGAKARRRLSSCGLRGGAKRQCGVGGNEAPAPRGEAARGIEGHRGIWMGDERSYPAWSTFTKSELDNHHFWWENYGKSPFLMGKLWKVTIFNRKNKLFLWPFSIAMLKLPEGICWLCPWTTAAVSRLTNQPTFVGELMKGWEMNGICFFGGIRI